MDVEEQRDRPVPLRQVGPCIDLGALGHDFEMVAFHERHVGSKSGVGSGQGGRFVGVEVEFVNLARVDHRRRHEQDAVTISSCTTPGHDEVASGQVMGDPVGFDPDDTGTPSVVQEENSVVAQPCHIDEGRRKHPIELSGEIAPTRIAYPP